MEATEIEQYNKRFETYLPSIRMSAIKLNSRQLKDKFTIDELVNEAWIRGLKTNRENKTEFLKRATWNMLEYIRSEIGRNDWVNADGSIGKGTKKITLITNMYTRDEDEEEELTGFFDIPTMNTDLKHLEEKELLSALFKKITKEQTKIVKSYYFKYNSLKDIGKELNRAECTICSKLKEAVKELREYSTVLN